MKTGFSLLFIITCIAITNIHAKDTLYYNQNWELTVKPNAEYFRVVAIKDGRYDGFFEDVHISSSQIVSEGNYKNGKLTNKYIERDTNGTLLIKGYYKNGVKEDIWSYYDTSGELKIKIDYSGEFARILEFYNESNKQILVNGKGELNMSIFIGNDEYIINANYKNGMRHGKWILRRASDGKKVIKERYSENMFNSGRNYLEKEQIYEPTLTINDLFYSKRIETTNKYVLSSKAHYTEIPKIDCFNSKIEDHFSLIDHTILEGFPNDMIIKLKFDKRGNLWFGTQKNGLFCMRNGQITKYDLGDDENIRISDIHVDNEGEIWVAFSLFGSYKNSGLARIVNDSLSVISVDNSGLTSNIIRCISSKNDSIIIGALNCINIYNKQTDSWSILNNPRIYKYRYDTSKINNSMQMKTFQYNNSNNVFIDISVYDDQIWVATTKGIDIYDQNHLFIINQENNSTIKNNWIGSLYADKDSLIICLVGEFNDGGMTIYKNGQWRNMNANNSILTRNMIDQVVTGPDDELWVLSSSVSLMKIQQNRLVQYDYYNSNTRCIILDIEIDQKGNLYAATGRGIMVKFKE